MQRAYIRRVDDTFIFRNLSRQAENIASCLYIINRHIQFTLEKQINNIVNFFDLTVAVINRLKLILTFIKSLHQTDDSIYL